MEMGRRQGAQQGQGSRDHCDSLGDGPSGLRPEIRHHPTA